MPKIFGERTLATSDNPPKQATDAFYFDRAVIEDRNVFMGFPVRFHRSSNGRQEVALAGHHRLVLDGVAFRAFDRHLDLHACLDVRAAEVADSVAKAPAGGILKSRRSRLEMVHI